MLTSRPQDDVLKACEAGVLKAEAARPERADKL
jgi:hypothetical protein